MDLLEKDRTRRIQTGAEVVQRASQLLGVSAPFPQGQVLLARAVTEAMLAVSIDTGEVTAPKPAVAPEDATQQTASLRGAGQ